MTITTSAAFEVVSWEQTTEDAPEIGSALARADVKKKFTGDLEAESTAIVVMSGAEDGSAGYIAMERIVGRLGNRTGSFVIQHGGIAGATAQTSFGQIVPGLGTGDLKGLSGECRFEHTDAGATFHLDYDVS